MKLTSILKNLLESFDYAELSDSERRSLNYIIHDKKHVTSNIGYSFSVLDKAIEKYSEKAPVVFRGVYPQETYALNRTKEGGTFSMNRYASFSESEEFARKYAKKSNTMMSVKNGVGFCFWKYVVADMEKLREEDPEAFRDEDGEYMIESAKEESEWIFAKSAEYRILNVKREGELRIVECEMV